MYDYRKKKIPLFFNFIFFGGTWKILYYVLQIAIHGNENKVFDVKKYQELNYPYLLDVKY